MTKIYFCGSIRGGKEMAATYQAIIGMLKQQGAVLTEHVGDKDEVSQKDLFLSDNEIHDRDMEWIRESDMVVAEVTIPSLGVGYEIGRAIELEKPVLCLFNSGSQKKLSAMIAGSEGVKLHSYIDSTGLTPVLSDFITRHAPRRTS
jgi:nucleoside 2-deoxyribosyltransferase